MSIYDFDPSSADRDQPLYHYSSPLSTFNPSPAPPNSFSCPPDSSSQRSSAMHPGAAFPDNRASTISYLGSLPPPFLRPQNGGYSFANPMNGPHPYFNRPSSHPNHPRNTITLALQPTNPLTDPRNTLWWCELEPWMDEEYAKQVCKIMNWDPINIKVTRPPPDPATGQQPNNPGYCFLSFASQPQAAAVLNQIHNGTSTIMPNSNKPFVLNWAPSVPASPPAPVFPIPPPVVAQHPPPPQLQPQQFIKEYSIFVGDLAPEVSNSDLVAVFRNPVLGLRNDREPRFIRPFLSCKSAKIMLDPVTGVSRGYGFVRFTDEADQQRALIEMHGLYCLSRPMRISPATAKYKLPASAPVPSGEMGSGPFSNGGNSLYPAPDELSLSAPPTANAQPHSVSAPLASSHAPGSNSALTAVSSSPSIPSLGSGHSASSTVASNSPEDVLKSQGSHGQWSTSIVGRSPSNNNSITAAFAGQQVQDHQTLSSHRYIISEESWKHHAQARAILSNLIGPNGEQLSSSDPYNTTVFVGGLSPLISEDTLRTFFAPFGEIHYVKVPAGKNCGFVQFIRKPDAERAIEKMQGFPIGGSRIRLSWGRSQYKAAQAAAQAAQTAALQSDMQMPQSAQPQPEQPQPNPPPSQSQSPQPQANAASISPEQALELIHKLGLTRFLNNPEPPSHTGSSDHGNVFPGFHGMNSCSDESLPTPMDQFSHSPVASSIDAQIMRSQLFNNFSPFSPDPNVYLEGIQHGDCTLHPESISHQSDNYGSGFGDGTGVLSRSGKVSPVNSATTTQNGRPNNGSIQRFGPLFEGSAPHLTRTSSRQDAIQRTSPTRKTPPGHERQTEYERQDPIQDLNGTLASLDLDNHQASWRHVVNSSRASPPSS